MEYNILLQKGKYALLETKTQYIIACGYDEKRPEGQQWDYGLYYQFFYEKDKKAEILSRAVKCFREKTEANYIALRQLEFYREDYSENAFQEILNVLGVSDDEVGESFAVYANVNPETLI